MFKTNIITSSYLLYLAITCLMLYHHCFVETAGESPAAAEESTGKQVVEEGGQSGSEQSNTIAGQHQEHHSDQGLLDGVVEDRPTHNHSLRTAAGHAGRSILEAEQSGMPLFPPTNVTARRSHSAGTSEDQFQIGLEKHYKRKISEIVEKISSKDQQIKKAQEELTDLVNEHKKLKALSDAGLKMNEEDGQQHPHEQHPQQQRNQQIYSQSHTNFPLLPSFDGQDWQQPAHSLPAHPAHSQQIPPRQLAQQSPFAIQQPHGSSFTQLLLQSGMVPPPNVQLPAQQQLQFQPAPEHPFQPPALNQQGQWMIPQPQVPLHPQLQTQFQPATSFNFPPNIHPHMLERQPLRWMMQATNPPALPYHQFMSNQQASNSQETIHQTTAQAQNPAHLLEVNDENSANVVENTDESTTSKGKGIMSASQSSVDGSVGGMRTKFMQDAMISGHYSHSPHSSSFPPSKSSSHLSAPLHVQQPSTMMMETGVKKMLTVDIWYGLGVKDFWVNIKRANHNKSIGTCATQKMATIELLPEYGIKEGDVLTVTVGTKKFTEGGIKIIPKDFRFSATKLYVVFPFTDKGIIILYDTLTTDQQTGAVQIQQQHHHRHDNNSPDAQEQDVTVD